MTTENAILILLLGLALVIIGKKILSYFNVRKEKEKCGGCGCH